MNRNWILVITLLLVAGCAKQPEPAEAKHADGATHHEEGHSETSVKLSPESAKLGGIELHTVGYKQVQESLQVPGTVVTTSTGRAVVTPPVAGRITSLSVQLGDQVRQGQVLAYLESPELAQSWSTVADATKIRDAAGSDRKQAEAEVELSLAKLSAAKTNLKRQRELASAGAFSQAPLQQAQIELSDAQSELLSVQKELASHAEQLRRLENLFREGIVSKSELDASRLELQQDQIRLDRAKAKIENAKATYDREKNIAGRGLLNAKELQAAEAEVRSGQLELDRARIRVRATDSAIASANRAIANAQAVYRSNRGSGAGSVGRAELVAPISGTISRLEVTRGQAVDRTQVLLEVEDLHSVWVVASVPEQDVAKVKKGTEVRVTVSALPGEEFRGIVQIVGSQVDPKTRTIATQCLVSGAAGRLKPQRFATVALEFGDSKRSLVVPKSSIVTEGRESFVFVKEGDSFEKRAVTTGSSTGDFVTISSGLKEKEEIAAKGTFVLSSEQKKGELKGHSD